ncbi:MAG: heparinase II/III family protein [Thermoguttaceae bacterium]|nr:heparinase II/III family protein [Thermoguttaceae bacterium]
MKSSRIVLNGMLWIVAFASWRPAVCNEAPCGDNAAPIPLPPLAYDVSAYELAPHLRAGGPHCWTLDEASSLLVRRVAAEKQRRELHVDYYRIGHTLAFPLPLAQRPSEEQLPPGIEGIRYPWTTWLSWELERRWRILHAGWRGLGDEEAGGLLQRELAALSEWDDFLAPGRGVSLVTGHLAASLSMALADPSSWDPALRGQALAAAQALLDRDVRPWFEQTWAGEKPLTPARLHNISVIALVRSAQLARTIDSPLTDSLDARARDVLHAWWKFRMGDERHTEGTAYDGYLADAITEWLAGLPDRDALLAAGREPSLSLAEEWLQLTLPGRTDLHAPLGDVEPEMPFWANALMRLAAWYNLEEAGWLLRRFPLERLPAAALAAVADDAPFLHSDFSMPDAGPGEHLASVTLRTGWESRDLLVAVGLPRCNMGHLHADGGQVILGWRGRFWITDPGYQQYRPGAEREYTIGPQAHNAPVIGGVAQSRRTAKLISSGTDGAGRQHAALDLTGGYAGLLDGASVRRDIWLVPGEAPAVIVRDSFAGLQPDVEVRTHWLGGAHLAWAFPAGWARLSDGEHALWIGTAPGSFEPGGLARPPGSRGPLTLEHVAVLPEGTGVRWWVFLCGATEPQEQSPPRMGGLIESVKD